MQRLLKYWLPVLVWLCFIFIGSSDLMSAEQTSRIIRPFLRWLKPDISVEAIAQVQFVVRKCAHVTEYAILAMLLWRALRGTLTSTRTLAIAALAFVASAIFAASDEFHQSFVPSRTASPIDVMIDVTGTLIGLATCVAVASRKVLKEKRF